MLTGIAFVVLCVSLIGVLLYAYAIKLDNGVLEERFLSRCAAWRRANRFLRFAQIRRKRFQRETYRLRERLERAEHRGREQVAQMLAIAHDHSRIKKELEASVEHSLGLGLDLTRIESENEADMRDAHQRLHLLTLERDHQDKQLTLAEGRIGRLAIERNRLRDEVADLGGQLADLRLAFGPNKPVIAVPEASEITIRHGKAAPKKRARRGAK